MYQFYMFQIVHLPRPSIRPLVDKYEALLFLEAWTRASTLSVVSS